jgi:hypothetical protein
MLIHQLEVAQEGRSLSVREQNLVSTLKLRLLGLAAVEKSRAKQKSRITWLKKGDTNTKYFHLMANIRKQRNFIHALQGRNTIAYSQKAKEDLVFSHFHDHIGKHVPDHVC